MLPVLASEVIVDLVGGNAIKPGGKGNIVATAVLPQVL